MYRDPSEFRKRFKAYKDGKSVREIYGLPRYVRGKSSSAIDDTADFLRLYEGFNEKTYLDGKGIPTIGYGFTDAKFVNKGRITRAEAEVELKRLIAVRQAELRRKLGPQVWDSLSNDSKKALTSYHFNYPAGFKDNTKFMLYWKAGRYSDAIKEVDAGWNDPNNPGLRTRRIAELKLLRNDPVLFQRPVSEKPSDAIILRPDALRVATIPTIQQQAIDYSDPRNSFAAEAERAIWARNVMDSLQEGYKVPMWESQPLPALLPVEMDVVPFKTYSNGKLPGYQGGKEATIQQGRKQLPIDKAEAATEPDYNEGWLLTTLKRGANNFIKTVKDLVRSARNIVNGRGDWFDWLNVGTDVVLGAGGKAVKGAANEAKTAAKTIKPKKSSVKFNTKDPNKVGAYYTAHPEEVTPVTNSAELNDIVDFMNTHIGPKYARLNKVHIGIDPANIKLGSADLSGTNLGGYVGPSGEVVINQDILNNSDALRRVLGHEVAGHWFDLNYPLTPSLASIILNGIRFNADFLNSRPWFNLFAEGNAERRLFNYLSSRDNGNVVGSELDAIINNMPRALAKRYADMLGYNKGIEWLWPDILPFKQAATSVPTIGVPLYAGILMDRQYKNGKLPGYEDGMVSKLINFVKNIFTIRDEKEDKKIQEDFSNLSQIGGRFIQRVSLRNPDFAIPEAVSFVLNYYNSPGFAERLQKMQNNISKYTNSVYNAGANDFSKYNKNKLKLGTITLNHNIGENAQYSHDTGNITYGDINGDLLENEYGAVIAHELGHAMDSSMGIDGKGFPSYSNSILPLRRGFLYRVNEKWLNENTNQKTVSDWRKYPEEFPYEIHHDKMPFEYYADLVAFRYWLKLAGIYDSTKANNPFTKEHLLKLYNDSMFGKFENRPLPVRRFTTEFSWDDIVKIMNEVAYIDSGKEDVLYAANGKLPEYSNGKIRIKPANRGKFNATKKRTGKTTEELTHSKNPLTRKRAIFALNARKWDHK